MDPLSLNNILSIINQYGYWIIFPISVIEGPIIAVIGGFLSSLGVLNLFMVYAVILFGDFIGDTIYYALGRWGKNIVQRYGPRFNLNEEDIEGAKKYFLENQTKAIILSKVIHGFGIAGLITSGALKISYIRFILTSSVVSIFQYALLLFVGVAFGRAYKQIDQYLNYFIIISSVLAIIAIIIFVKRLRIKTFKGHK